MWLIHEPIEGELSISYDFQHPMQLIIPACPTARIFTSNKYQVRLETTRKRTTTSGHLCAESHFWWQYVKEPFNDIHDGPSITVKILFLYEHIFCHHVDHARLKATFFSYFDSDKMI